MSWSVGWLCLLVQVWLGWSYLWQNDFHLLRGESCWIIDDGADRQVHSHQPPPSGSPRSHAKMVSRGGWCGGGVGEVGKRKEISFPWGRRNWEGGGQTPLLALESNEERRGKCSISLKECYPIEFSVMVEMFCVWTESMLESGCDIALWFCKILLGKTRGRARRLSVYYFLQLHVT